MPERSAVQGFPLPAEPPIRQTLLLEGRLWLLVATALIGVGLFKAINLIVLVGYLMLALLLVNYFVGAAELRKVEAKRCLPSSARAGEAFPWEIELRSRDGSPLSAVIVEDTGPGYAVGWFAAALVGTQPTRCRQTVVPRQRGRHRLAPLLVRTRYPFGLVERRLTLPDANDSLLVFPQIGELDLPSLRRRLERLTRTTADGRRSRLRQGTEGDFIGLRPFQVGDSPRAVAWRNSARRGEILVRQFAEVESLDLLLIVDAPTPLAGETAAFERLIRLAATIVEHWNRQPNLHFILLLGHENPTVIRGVTGPELRLRMLQVLAETQGGPVAEPRRILAAANAHRHASVVLVAVSEGTTGAGERWSNALGRPILCVTPKTAAWYQQPPESDTTLASAPARRS